MKIVILLFVLTFTVPAAAQFDTPWDVDGTGTIATGNGLGGALIYTCASAAPSRGAVAGVFRNVTVPDGNYRGAVGNIQTTWLCTDLGSFVSCFVQPRDVARIRDALIRLNSVTAVLGPDRDPITVALVGLRGSAAAIERVRRSCR